MGGRALKQIKTNRKSTEDFIKIYGELSKIIVEHLSNEIHLVKYYHTKESHGDMDILLKISDIKDYEKINEFINNIIKPCEVLKNDIVYSFNYFDFQIDFILINESLWETAITYFDYDCLGNVMGKTYHKFNLSYGWNGLYYKFRNFNGRLCDNILISRDPRKIFQFCDYDYDRYLLGFDYIEEIFDYIQKSKYFNADIFKMENLKGIDKKRNNKRNSYHSFLNYIETHKHQNNHEFNKDKDIYLPMIDNFFPEAKFMDKLHNFNIIDKENKILSQKFNGDIVMSWLPNLMGKELGCVMSKFKDALGDDYKTFILNSTYNQIHDCFMNIHKKIFEV